MSAPQDKRPIIVRRKRPGHTGHHGGSWKVAYADFVTALMAFFLVMWIMGMDPEVKDLVEGYFANPVGFRAGGGAGQNPLANGNALQNLSTQRLSLMVREAQRARFERAAQEIRDSLAAAPGIEALRGRIEVLVTPEGLRIELIESGAREVFFESGSARPTPQAVAVLQIIGRGLQRLQNPIVIEGHTDARVFGSESYTNWELSVDRANAARRQVLGAGVAAQRIAEVRGYAARNPRVKDDPTAPSNRRVSILLPYVEAAARDVSGGRAAQP